MKQVNLPSLPKGVYRAQSGHLRYTSPPERKNKYVHREVVASCLRETPYSVLLLIPFPYEVHHMDYNKEHNCPSNLLLIGESLHSHQTADRKRHKNGRFLPRWRGPDPWWPLFDTTGDEEAPF